MKFPALQVTDEEMAVLIELSDREHVLEVNWGSGSIPHTWGNRWALNLLLCGRLAEVEAELLEAES